MVKLQNKDAAHILLLYPEPLRLQWRARESTWLGEHILRSSITGPKQFAPYSSIQQTKVYITPCVLPGDSRLLHIMFINIIENRD